MPNILNQLNKMSKIDSKLLKSKFRGTLLGSLLGDCLGAPYEGETVTSGEKIIIQRYFDKLESPNLKAPIRPYTDDTAMMKSVAQSLIDRPEIDYTHMAKLFVKEFYQSSNRGYGQNVVEVFSKLRKRKFDDVYKPAREQFSGSGSFGNGGAMRIAPISLYFYERTELMIQAAKNSTSITHTHPLGINGAVLQSLAVHQALLQHPQEKISPEEFCDTLIAKIKPLEKEDDDDFEVQEEYPYEEKMKMVKHFLGIKYNDELDDEIIENIGNNISAYGSVPTAIYCFLRALQNDIPYINSENLFRRTIQYAISFGGDADTIACMAGAIAGAYLGEDGINSNIARQCEYYEGIISLADQLYDSMNK